MAKNTSILLGDHFDNFIKEQINTGKLTSASEVIRAALRLFEYEKIKRDKLIQELKKGEESGFIEDFNFDDFIKEMRHKYIDKK